MAAADGLGIERHRRSGGAVGFLPRPRASPRPAGEPSDPGAEESNLLPEQSGELAVVVVKHPVSDLDEVTMSGLQSAWAKQVSIRAR